MAKISVCVFAHNESRRIVRSLDSVCGTLPGAELVVHVVANGCSDNTAQVVSDYAKSHPEVQLHDVAFGDKANAWNVYIHQYCSDADVHVFLDGDCYAAPGALVQLIGALQANPHANGAAALPITGRACAETRRVMQKGRDLAGNLYALSSAFVNKLRQSSIAIPTGLIGEDTLVGAFAKFDLESRYGDWQDERVIAVPEAGFGFDSFQWYDLGDLKTYWRRRIRYSLRRLQFIVLRDDFLVKGFAAMPKAIAEIYPAIGQSQKLSWRGVDTIFDYFALKRIQEYSQSRSS